MESFEDGIPPGLKATGGELNIDTMRMKHGNKALKWNWVGNSSLVFDSPIGYRKQRDLNSIHSSESQWQKELNHVTDTENPMFEPPRGFFLWIYNDQARQQRLRFQFGRKEVVDCQFDFNLNFKGWRTVYIIYDRGDMQGVPREDMTRLTIHAPNIGKGTFYFDVLGLSLPLNPRNNAANPQLPHIDHHARYVTQYAQRLFEYSKQQPHFPIEVLTPNLIAEIAKMEARAEDFILTQIEKDELKHKGMSYLEDDLAKIKIRRDGENIYGRPMAKSSIFEEYFIETGIDKKELLKGVVYMNRDYCGLLIKTAKLYRSTEDIALKKKLEKIFIDLIDYGLDQGFDEGEGLGWLHHYSYVIRDHAPSMFLMRNVLEKHGRLEKIIRVMKWFNGFNQVYNEDVVYGVPGRKAADADDTQGLLIPRYLTALIMKDSPEKVRDLRHFSSFFSNVTTAYSNALDEVFKPDGTVFHHAGHSCGYGGRALHGAVVTMYLLSHSPFHASNQSYRRMKKVTEAFLGILFTSDLSVPRGFSGIRFTKYKLPEHFRYIPALMALASENYDQEMAACYKRIIEVVPIKNEKDIFWEAKIDKVLRDKTDEFSYKKMRVMPYSSKAVRREGNDWLTTVRGHGKYVYAFESWGAPYFAFPLFIGNGFLDVSYPDDLNSTSPMTDDTWHTGYDWRRWPGTTTVRLPYAKMLSRPRIIRDEGGEYLFSDQSFVGGVESTDGKGIYVFPFKGHDKFDIQSFTGKKSYFFIDDMVVCLGSNINCDLPNYQVETTLFQNHLEAKDEAIIGSENTYTQFPLQTSLSVKSPMWLIDNRNTGYYLPSQAKIDFVFERKVQTNPDAHNREEVSGDFASLYIDHGKSPKDAAYRYVVLPDANPSKMESFTQAMNGKVKPYKVIRQDNTAHIVASPQTGSTSYAIFDADGMTFKSGIVSKVSKAATFIVSEHEDNVSLTIADPDLNIYDGQDDLLPDGRRTELSIYEREWFFWPSRASTIQITLDGKWEITQQIKEMETAEMRKAKIVLSSKKQTVIEFECRDGLSSEVGLVRVGKP